MQQLKVTWYSGHWGEEDQSVDTALISADLPVRTVGESLVFGYAPTGRTYLIVPESRLISAVAVGEEDGE